jgi:hypothetical protein
MNFVIEGSGKLVFIGKIFNQDFSTKISDSKNPKGKGGKLFISKMIIENNFSGVIKVTNEKKTYENQEYTGACVAISLHK